MSVIDEMSRLVLANPNITAREIARKLGYAEEKSVYYWLQKAGYSGMKDFKGDVLRRILPAAPKMEPPVVRDVASQGISVYSDADPRTAKATLREHLEGYLGRDSFGVILTRAEYPPLAEAGDLLIVDPGAPSFQGDLVWASVAGKMRLARQYGLPDKTFLYVDAGKPGEVLTPDFVSGKVVFILRRLS